MTHFQGALARAASDFSPGSSLNQGSPSNQGGPSNAEPLPPKLPGAFPQGTVQMPSPPASTERRAFDPSFFKSVFNLKEVVCPITLRKTAFWSGYAALSGGLITLEYYTGASRYVVDVIRYTSTALLTIIYGTEPVLSAINLLLAEYPDAAKEIDEESRIIPSPGAEEIALVIPCHNSADVVTKTLTAALKHLKPEQIFVMDNGHSETPSDNTKEVVASIDPRINYLYVPIGNKVIAQYAGTIAAKEFRYILTTDDDVTIPENFDFGTQMINDRIKAVCYPVRAISGDGKPSIWVEWQDIEYQNADLAKLAETDFGGVLYPHGAGSLWDKETLKEVLRRHDTIFYADDIKMGIILQELRKAMVICASSCLKTEAPTTFCGNSDPNLYEQRVRSWDMGRHVYFFKFAKAVFLPGTPRSALGHTYTKGVQILTVISNVADYARIPILAVLIAEPGYWAKVGAFTAASTVPAILWNYVKVANRPDLQSTFRAVSTVSAYKFINSAVSIAGFFRALCIYLPNFQHKPTITELEEQNDPRCVWLEWDQAIDTTPTGLGNNRAPEQPLRRVEE